MTKITKIYFDSAKYLVGDENSENFLVVDYKNNKFKYEGKMKKKVSKIAKDVLRKKHDVNFAKKFELY